MIDAVVPAFLAELDEGARTPCHRQGHLFMPDRALAEDDVARARALCAACPLTTACLAHALAAREQLGIWGGCTPEERETLSRGGARPECGTEKGWRSHLSRHERCTICLEEHEARMMVVRRARLDEEHSLHGGSLAGYRLELLLKLPTCAGCRAARRAYYNGGTDEPKPRGTRLASTPQEGSALASAHGDAFSTDPCLTRVTKAISLRRAVASMTP